MSDEEPRMPGRGLSLIAPLIVAAVTAAIVVMLFLSQRKQTPVTPAAIAVSHPAKVPAPAIFLKPLPPPPPLDRWQLVQLANAEVAAFSSGAALPEKPGLVGSKFIAHIPFGCDGLSTAAGAAQAFAVYDAENQTIKLIARPNDWATSPLATRAGEAQSIEAVEGFWIPRPWANSDACPAKVDSPPPPIATPPSAQTLGLARFFDAAGSRLARHGDQPYETTLKVEPGDVSAVAQTYRLTLEGRIVGYADGRAIHCWTESPQHRPVCFYAVEWDRVAFENGSNGNVLAEWHD